MHAYNITSYYYWCIQYTAIPQSNCNPDPVFSMLHSYTPHRIRPWNEKQSKVCLRPVITVPPRYDAHVDTDCRTEQ